MSYIALARKWRPRRFNQLVGQDHVTTALTNSLSQQRIHHAYLFTGTRGVGKTSIARLFAKALNCEQGIGPNPCLSCDACIAVEQGRFIDLIEIDGASRTRVEDTREILDNVQYAATVGRFKIYLIDEVHMLSSHSFNALLKTLEEPPAHVKFLLATTDPQKLPMTVLSRCLQFNLRHLAPEIIAAHLEYVLGEEHFAFEPEALTILAKAANGSMRDAMSLLDQAIASAPEQLSSAAVKQMLGFTQMDYALLILQALARRNPNQMIETSRHIANEGGQYHYVLQEMTHYFHQLAIAHALGDLSTVLSDALSSLKTAFSAEDLQLFYQISSKGIEELSFAPSLTIGFEMTLLRLYTFMPAADQVNPILAYEKPIDNQVLTPQPSAPAPEPAPTIRTEIPSIPTFLEQVPVASSHDWPNLILKLKLQGLALTAAENALWDEMHDQTVRLKVAKGHHSLFTNAVISRIEQGLTTQFGQNIKIELIEDKELNQTPAKLRQKAEAEVNEHAVQNLQNDPVFQKLQQEFAAELVKNSIAPVKDDL